MGMGTTLWLAGAMAAIAVANTALMAWLWRFPMVPDPTGRDPNGVSTAPRSWTNVHRGLGYLFLAVYLALAVEMVPRLWEYREWSAVSVVHASLGLLVGVLLAGKILVIRRYPRFGHRLPWIGGALAAVTLAVVALGAVPARRVVRPGAPLTPALEAGRRVVEAKCVQCHGASKIAFEREEARKWHRITREMQRNSRRMAGKLEITDEERALVTAYLIHLLAEPDDDGPAEAAEDAADEEADAAEEAAEDAAEGGQRRRRRGRDR
jgi:mono/diheme cytochrome c family protein